MPPTDDRLTRRGFLGTAAAAAAVAGIATTRAEAAPKLPRRKLGKTGLDVSTLVYGSEFLDENSIDLLERLIESGVNYIDTAPMYRKGGVERTLAPVLRRHRDKLILASKWYPKQDGSASKDHFLQSFDASCERMGVEGVDLIQIHDCRTPVTVNSAGGFEAFQELKEQGRAKWYGLTTHVGLVTYGKTDYSQPTVIRKAIELGWYDTCLAAWNFMSKPDETKALQEAAAAGMGVMTMKALKPLTAHGQSWCPTFDHGDARKILKADNLFQASIRWSLSHKFIAALAVCMRNYDEVEQNLEAAMGTA